MGSRVWHDRENVTGRLAPECVDSRGLPVRAWRTPVPTRDHRRRIRSAREGMTRPLCEWDVRRCPCAGNVAMVLEVCPLSHVVECG